MYHTLVALSTLKCLSYRAVDAGGFFGSLWTMHLGSIPVNETSCLCYFKFHMGDDL